MSNHKEYSTEQDDWTAFNILVDVCCEEREIFLSTTRVRKNNKSFKNVKQSKSHEQERPIKKLRGYYHPQQTQAEITRKNMRKRVSVSRPAPEGIEAEEIMPQEIEAEEIMRKNKRKRVPVSRLAPEPRVKKQKLNKAQEEELASILAQDYDLPEEYRQKIRSMNQTGDAKLVIQKMLHHADVENQQNRFSMPLKQLRCTDFLTDEERKLVEERTENNHLKSIKVKVIEPNEALRVGEASFRKWDMNKADGKASHSYLLNGGWKDIRLRNNLEAHMVMQLWAFRTEEGELCFALVKLPVDLKNVN